MRYLKSPSHSHKLIWMLLSSFMVMAGGMHPTLWGFFGEANILLLFILRVIFSESCVELFGTPQVMLVHILDFMWLLSNVLHCATITFALISLNSCLPFCGVDAWTAELLMETRPWHLQFRLLFTWGVAPLSPQQSSSGIQALSSPCTAGPKRPLPGSRFLAGCVHTAVWELTDRQTLKEMDGRRKPFWRFGAFRKIRDWKISEHLSC